MFDELNIYKKNGHFFYDGDSKLKDVCNAPKGGIGVYYIYALAHGRVELVYIGSYGKLEQNETLKFTEEGLYNDLIRDSKLESWNVTMLANDVDAIDIYWFETFNKKTLDIPTTIEGIIMQRYFDLYESIPPWNDKF